MKNLFRKLTQSLSPTKVAPPVRRRVTIDPLDYPLIYVIGDVHGCLSLLLELEQKILADAPSPGRKLVILLGDYVDRGPQSYDVIAHLLKSPVGFDRLCLCGNHDDAFLQFVKAPAKNLGWLEFGGIETLRSYGLDATHIIKAGGGMAALATAVSETVPSSHLEFLADLPVSISYGDYLFVHAGIKPGVRLDQQVDSELMWMREPFLTQGPKLPITVIHGHTAASEPVFGPNRICIDTGAYATGRLTLLRIFDGKAAIAA